MARAKRAAVGFALLFALVALLSGARVLLIEAAVPPERWLGEFRYFDPGWSQKSVLPERSVAYLDVLLRDPSLVHARYVACRERRERASAAGDAEGLAAAGRACLAAIDRALAVSPASATLWIERARLANFVGKSNGDVARSLRHSYRVGEREGWLMARRISLLATMWPRLPADLQNQGQAELDAVLGSWPISRNLGRIFLRGPDVRHALIERIEQSSDRQAKRRFLDALHSLTSEEGWPLPKAEVAVVAGGEAWQGPPAFRLWADSVMIAEVEVKGAIDTARLEPVTPQMINDAMRTYFITVPDIETVKSIAIEFYNDAWAGEGKRGDRNLWIREVSVGGTRYSASDLVPETASPELALIVDGLAALAAPGRFRIDRPALGWPNVH